MERVILLGAAFIIYVAVIWALQGLPQDSVDWMICIVSYVVGVILTGLLKRLFFK